MRLMLVANVGDGLCTAIRTTIGEIVQIDCGSTAGARNLSGPRSAFDGLCKIIDLLSTPRTIFLSHIHIDHYNGLIYADTKGSAHSFLPLNMKEVIFPGIPDFSRKREFLFALLTMNLRLLGDETGIAEYELVKLITRLNAGKRPQFGPVYQGDHVMVGGSYYTILWPPRMLAENEPAAKTVVQALKLFKRALQKDETTRKWYEYVRETNLDSDYLDRRKDKMPSDQDRGRLFPEFLPRKLPAIVDKANKALRKAANRLSLSFLEDSGDFLFMGDMESKEVKMVVDNALASNRRYFRIFVTPHHGTHWNKALLNLKCTYAISSCGRKHYRNLCFKYDRICLEHRATWECGDVICWIT